MSSDSFRRQFVELGYHRVERGVIVYQSVDPLSDVRKLRRDGCVYPIEVWSLDEPVCRRELASEGALWRTTEAEYHGWSMSFMIPYQTCFDQFIFGNGGEWHDRVNHDPKIGFV